MVNSEMKYGKYTYIIQATVWYVTMVLDIGVSQVIVTSSRLGAIHCLDLHRLKIKSCNRYYKDYKIQFIMIKTSISLHNSTKSISLVNNRHMKSQ